MRWTRKGIIEEIRRLHAAGEELNYKTVEENHLNLVRAASWHFGTWKRAIEKAGLDYDDVSKYQKWSRERVVERIQELYRQGKDLSWRSISTEVDPPLAAAALRENSGFESWFEAITAAGLNHDEIARYRRWTRERVLEEIADRFKNGMPMSSIAVQRQNSPLYCAAKRRFLQWDNALEAAGLDPNKIRIRKAPDAPKPRRRRGAAGQLVIPEMEAPEPSPVVRPTGRRRKSEAPTVEEAAVLLKPAKKATKVPTARAKAAPTAPAPKVSAKKAAPAKAAPAAVATAAPKAKTTATKPAVAKPVATKAAVAKSAPAAPPVKDKKTSRKAEKVAVPVTKAPVVKAEDRPQTKAKAPVKTAKAAPVAAPASPAKAKGKKAEAAAKAEPKVETKVKKAKSKDKEKSKDKPKAKKKK